MDRAGSRAGFHRNGRWRNEFGTVRAGVVNLETDSRRRTFEVHVEDRGCAVHVQREVLPELNSVGVGETVALATLW